MCLPGEKETLYMAFDFKKEYKEYYMPNNKPSIVEVPAMNYVYYQNEQER